MSALPRSLAAAMVLALPLDVLGADERQSAVTTSGAVETNRCPPLTRAAARPFSITVDGQPLEPADGTTEPDRSRCADVALERSEIQIKFDALAAVPALNAWPYPTTPVQQQPVEFHAYANYLHWIRRAEVRLFHRGDNLQQTPRVLLPIVFDAPALWTPAPGSPADWFYVLRVYDVAGRFDETAPKALAVLPRALPGPDKQEADRERLIGWGEGSRNLANIPVSGGTVTVSGKLATSESVIALGEKPPVDREGRFAIRQILPSGPHTVEVRVRDGKGGETMFRRSLSIANEDWFYVAIADLTVGRNNVSGPAQLVTGDTSHYEDRVFVDGRGAFYLKGKIKGEWLLTASADTSEQPLKDLLSNFGSKDPRYLLRRIDPDRFYPVYGDDSTTIDDAPTQGKLYVRLEKGESHVMWGNFQTQWTGSELTAYSRGLYGANLLWKSDPATSFGERRSQVNAFAAEPGTIAARDEFRGTGGSLYYLRHQDITQGAERIWVEIRDKDSGIVLERRQLQPALDYEVNWLQGRIALSAPLPSTADGSTLVQTGSLAGYPAWLVVTYEYAPGLTAVDSLAYGLQASHWLNDYVRLGVTGYRQGDAGARQTLEGLNATLRYKPGTWLRVETARSSGAGTTQLSSISGGYDFNQTASTGEAAVARRVEAAADFAEMFEGGRGRLQAYWQDREQGYSAPGLLTPGEAVTQKGLKADIALTERTSLLVKADSRDSATQGVDAIEVNLRHRIAAEWSVGVGARADERRNNVPNASPILSENGARTDAVARLEYKPLRATQAGETPVAENWEAYGYGQNTLATNGTRTGNDRIGVGGLWRYSERLKFGAELSGGDGGAGAKLTGDWQMDDRSNSYLQYALETDNPDALVRGSHGTWVSGGRYRASESATLFSETRATHGAGPVGMTQAFGLDLAPIDRWTLGTKFEFGTVSDPLAGDLKRRAMGMSVAYRQEKTKFASLLEYRTDTSADEQRTTWLTRSSLGWQTQPDWRAQLKLNASISESSKGAFYDGRFVEFVSGAAYRPVMNDRWNALLKYTYFYDLPSPGQVSASGVLADYSQRSHVVSADVMHDVIPSLTLGAKLGVRMGELRDNRVDGPWFSSLATLIVLRADWHVVREWDAVVEARRLAAREAADARSGLLVAVYRRVAEHLKAGVGYNFTNFSDNLTDLSYRSRGWFINAVGTF